MPNNTDILQLLPQASQWIEEQESYILKHGVELTPDQQIDAFLVGVSDPTKIRVMAVDEIPTPTSVELKEASVQLGLLPSDAIGIAFRHGIYVQKSAVNLRRLLAHELTHTKQYERFGSVQLFLEQYLKECMEVGYAVAPLELEAREMEKVICD